MVKISKIDQQRELRNESILYDDNLIFQKMSMMIRKRKIFKSLELE